MVAAGEAARHGKWDEEAQARASGSVGKQILQRYLTHLYPKVRACTAVRVVPYEWDSLRAASSVCWIEKAAFGVVLSHKVRTFDIHP